MTQILDIFSIVIYTLVMCTTKIIALILVGLTLSACGSEKAAVQCQSAISAMDAKLAKINNLNTMAEVEATLGAPDYKNPNSPQSYVYYTSGCKTYRVFYSDNHPFYVQYE